MDKSTTHTNEPRFLARTVLPSIIQAAETYQSFKRDQQLQSTMQQPITSALQDPTIDSFTVFPNLPAEIRLKVWRKASDRSVIIDLWTEYRKCEITNVIFYHQYYATKLADTYSRVLQVNRESRDEVSIHSF